MSCDFKKVITLLVAACLIMWIAISIFIPYRLIEADIIRCGVDGVVEYNITNYTLRRLHHGNDIKESIFYLNELGNWVEVQHKKSMVYDENKLTIYPFEKHITLSDNWNQFEKGTYKLIVYLQTGKAQELMIEEVFISYDDRKDC